VEKLLNSCLIFGDPCAQRVALDAYYLKLEQRLQRCYFVHLGQLVVTYVKHDQIGEITKVFDPGELIVPQDQLPQAFETHQGAQTVKHVVRHIQELEVVSFFYAYKAF